MPARLSSARREGIARPAARPAAKGLRRPASVHATSERKFATGHLEDMTLMACSVDPLNSWAQDAVTRASWQLPRPAVQDVTLSKGSGERAKGGRVVAEGNEQGPFEGARSLCTPLVCRSVVPRPLSCSYLHQQEIRRKAVPRTIPAGRHTCNMCYDRTRTVQFDPLVREHAR